MSDETQLKRAALIKMFVCFPSSRVDAASAEITLCAYLDLLSDYGADDVVNACRRATIAAGAFAPSAPEVRRIAESIVTDRIRRERAAMPRLPAPSRGIDALPAEDREKQIQWRLAVADELRAAAQATRRH